MIRARLGVLLVLLPLLAWGCGHSEAGLPWATLRVGDARLKVELALTPEQHARGLMYRRELSDRRGMLFVYEREQTLRFWMKNTFIPLSIAYVDAGGVIVDIQDMQPQDTTTHPSSRPARFALEVNQGWFAAHGVDVGAQLRVTLPDGTELPPK